MKKKLMSILTIGLMATFLLSGCGSSTAGTSASGNTESTERTSESETVTAEESSTTADDASSEDSSSESADSSVSSGKMLVLYFSGSGHTKNVADAIADNTGADEFEITPSEPYTNDDLNYNDDNSRVSKEHNDASLQDVKFDSYDVPNWNSYDTVFVGYPIWWMDASWVMKSYVSHVDFTGKKVIPFCTSFSSGIGDSAENLAKLAGTGDWQEGYRFDQNASADDVKDWVNSLGL